MKESDFYKLIKDKMESYEEIPDPSSWDSIQSELSAGSRRVVFFRITRTVAALAAAVALFLIIGKDSIWRSLDPPLKADIIIQDSQSEKEPPAASATDKVPAASHRIRRADTPVTKSDKIEISKEEQEPRNLQEENKPSPEPQKAKREPSVQLWPSDEEVVVKRRRFNIGKPSIALSTTLSPSSGSTERSLQTFDYITFNELSSSLARERNDLETLYDTRYLPPVSIGLQVSVPLTKSLFAVTGINYTMLYSITEERTFNQTIKKEESLHYIGIPLYLYSNIFTSRNFSLYGGGGFTLEKGLAQRIKLNGPIPYVERKSVRGYQWSAGVAVGAEYLLGRNIGLYADPMLTYYFYNYQPKSIRTAQPLQFKLEIGLRYRF